MRWSVIRWNRLLRGSASRTRQGPGALSLGLDNPTSATGMGTDWTLMPPNPFEVLSFLVTRKNRFGELVGPDQRITRREALRLGTMDNAYITFEEKVKGSIEPGKLADFIELDRDYLTVPDDDIKKIGVLRTVVGGKVVFEKQ